MITCKRQAEKNDVLTFFLNVTSILKK